MRLGPAPALDNSCEGLSVSLGKHKVCPYILLLPPVASLGGMFLDPAVVHPHGECGNESDAH